MNTFRVPLANKIPSQVALMARAMKELFPGIELGSVDGFQGREKEVRKQIPPQNCCVSKTFLPVNPVETTSSPETLGEIS